MIIIIIIHYEMEKDQSKVASGLGFVKEFFSLRKKRGDEPKKKKGRESCRLCGLSKLEL